MEDPCSVRVAVRVRPLIGHEKVERCGECIQVVEGEPQLVIGKDRCFTYDYVFSKYAQQSDLWSCVQPIVQSSIEGFNATIFAYGQTGSGKTFTMGSGSNLTVLEEERGVIPQAIYHIFDQIEKKREEGNGYEFSIRLRFLEIYGEEIRDLFDPLGATNDGKIMIREGDGHEVIVAGATEEEVESAEDVMRLLEKGTLCRSTGSTLMNAHSSRSHAILTLIMEQRIPIEVGSARVGSKGESTDTEASKDLSKSSPDASAEEQQMKTDSETTIASSGTPEFETRVSFFNFVDLAGSERQKRTQAVGQRLKEGIDINKGLLALGNVISALGDEKKRGRVHVPYRDSKLTRMLQDSLGGNSRTLMITCVSPADLNFEETLNTLKYANRARNIQNKPVVNRDAGSAAVAELRRQVQLLQAEVVRLNGGDSSVLATLKAPSQSSSGGSALSASIFAFGGSSPPSATSLSPAQFEELIQLRERCKHSEDEISRLMQVNKRQKTQLSQLGEESILARAERDYYRLQEEDRRKLMQGKCDPEDSGDTGLTKEVQDRSPEKINATNEEPETTTHSVGEAGDNNSTPGKICAAPESHQEGQEEKEKQKTVGVLAGYLRTISELKRKLQEKEEEVERANADAYTRSLSFSRRPSSGRKGSVVDLARQAIEDEARALARLKRKAHKAHKAKAAEKENLSVSSSAPRRSLPEGDSVGKEGESTSRSASEERLSADELCVGSSGLSRCSKEEQTRGGVSVSESASVNADSGTEREAQASEVDEEDLTEAEKQKEKDNDDDDDDDEEEDGAEAEAEGEGEADEEDQEDAQVSGEEEAEEAEKQRLFQHRQQQMSASVADLSTSISLKQQLVSELENSQRQYDIMKEFYEQKLAQMNEEVRLVQQGRDKLLEELQALENRTVEEKKNEKSNLLRKLKEKDAKLLSLQKKQSEYQQYTKMKSRTELQMRQLYTDISNMKKQKVEIQRKMDLERKRYQQEAAQRRKEILNLRKERQKDKQTIRQLGNAKEAQDRVLRRRIEEMTAANRRLKKQTGAAMTADERRKKKWLDSEIKKLAARQAKAEKLEKELSKREALVKSMEELYKTRTKLQESMKAKLFPATIREVLTSPSKPKTEKKKNSANDDTSRKLTPEEEEILFELEERIESCQEQLKYKDETISRIARDVEEAAEEAGDDDGEPFGMSKTLERMKASTLPEARVLMKILFDMVVQVKSSESKTGEDLRDVSQRLKDTTFEYQEAEDRLQRLKLDYDQRLTKIQKEHEEKLSFYLDFYCSTQNKHNSNGSHEGKRRLAEDNILEKEEVSVKGEESRLGGEDKTSGSGEQTKQRDLPLLDLEGDASAEDKRQTIGERTSVEGEGEADDSVHEEDAISRRMNTDLNLILRKQVEQLEKSNSDLSSQVTQMLQSRKEERAQLRQAQKEVDKLEKALQKLKEQQKEAAGPVPSPVCQGSGSCGSAFSSPVRSSAPKSAPNSPARSATVSPGARSPRNRFSMNSPVRQQGSGNDDSSPVSPRKSSVTGACGWDASANDTSGDEISFSDGTSPSYGPLNELSQPSSIFERLANPRNFTGMHKQRLRDNLRRKEEVREQMERARARRRRDRQRELGDRPASAPASKIPTSSSPRPRTSTASPASGIQEGSSPEGAPSPLRVAFSKKEKEQTTDRADTADIKLQSEGSNKSEEVREIAHGDSKIADGAPINQGTSSTSNIYKGKREQSLLGNESSSGGGSSETEELSLANLSLDTVAPKEDGGDAETSRRASMSLGQRSPMARKTVDSKALFSKLEGDQTSKSSHDMKIKDKLIASKEGKADSRRAIKHLSVLQKNSQNQSAKFADEVLKGSTKDE